LRRKPLTTGGKHKEKEQTTPAISRNDSFNNCRQSKDLVPRTCPVAQAGRGGAWRTHRIAVDKGIMRMASLRLSSDKEREIRAAPFAARSHSPLGLSEPNKGVYFYYVLKKKAEFLADNATWTYGTPPHWLSY